jgi:hypothetical protein
MRQGKLQSRIEALEAIHAPQRHKRFVFVPRDADETEREAILADARAKWPGHRIQVMPCERIELEY